MFQFTHPGRGATCISSSRALSTSAFQFTHPGRGATLLPIFQSVLQWFQFTHPGRGATAKTFEDAERAIVSIHAPREGCDPDNEGKSYVERSFQFTHPGRGATYLRSTLAALWVMFQFTHPGRGATQTEHTNSRTLGVSIHAPREGCDVCWLVVVAYDNVSIHAPREGCDLSAM